MLAVPPFGEAELGTLSPEVDRHPLLFEDSREKYTINILTQQNKIENFICINKFPTTNESLNSYLYQNKQSLMERRMRNFNEMN